MARLGIGFNVNGQFRVFPHVHVDINADNLDLRPTAATGICVIMGEGTGFFAPKVPTALPFDVGSPQRFLAPSDLLAAAEYAVRPFPQLARGAGQVYVVPVTPATPATFTIEASGGADLAILTTKGWGPRFNTVTCKSETGKVTLALPTERGSIIETYLYSTIAGLVADIQARSALASAAFVAEGAATTFAATAFTGGSAPAATTADWAEAFTSLNGLRVNVIHPVSADPAIWQMLSTYCVQTRSRGVVGGTLRNWNGTVARAAAITALKAEAAALNAPRIMHVGLGADGLPGSITAARYAALACSLEPSVPMTFKQLGFFSLEAILDIPSEVDGIDGLLLYGLAPPVRDPQAPGLFIQSRQLSTWTGGDNLYDREWSVLAAVDAVQDIIEARLRAFLGGEGTRDVIERVVAEVDRILAEMTLPGASIRIASYRPESITATFSQTLLRVSAALTPIQPINAIHATLTLEATEISVSFNVNLAAAA